MTRYAGGAKCLRRTTSHTPAATDPPSSSGTEAHPASQECPDSSMYRAIPAHTSPTTAPVRWSGCTHDRPVSTSAPRSDANAERSNSVSE